MVLKQKKRNYILVITSNINFYIRKFIQTNLRPFEQYSNVHS